MHLRVEAMPMLIVVMFDESKDRECMKCPGDFPVS